MVAATINRLLKNISVFAFLTIPLHASAGLLSNIETETANTAEGILEVLMPIASYDPSVVQIRVINDGIKVFDGIDKDLDIEMSGFKDDANILKYLAPNADEILLSVPVEVTLNSDHISKFKSKLSNLADVSETVDGSSNNRITELPVVWIDIGSIKGDPRTEIYTQENPVGDFLQSHYNLGMKNWKIGHKSVQGESPMVHKPFTHYSFGNSHHGGQLCQMMIEKIAGETKPSGVWDTFTNKIKPGTKNFWSLIYPAITIKFIGKNNELLQEDLLTFTSPEPTAKRTASATGWGSGEVGGRDTFQSIVTEDTKHGWHPQDSNTASKGQLDKSMRFSEITNVLKMNIDPLRRCRFGIAEQTNYSIITKVNGDIVKNTEKITVEYSPQKDWMHRLCLSDGWEKNVNCKRY